MNGLPAQPALQSSRVRLRMLESSDIPDLFAMLSDAQFMRYWSCPAYTSIAQAQELFQKHDRGVRAGEFNYWAITLPPDDRFVGQCVMFNVNAPQRRAEIGYGLARPHWGHGYAREAMELVLDYAFGALALHRLEADVDPRNSGSVRLLERLGFVREGLLRERWHVNGEVSDSAIYGLLAPDHAAATNAAVESEASSGVTPRTA
ncbi:MAG: GNAT family N-acetyltransferase [Rudaea sp.]